MYKVQEVEGSLFNWFKARMKDYTKYGLFVFLLIIKNNPLEAKILERRGFH